MTQMHSKVKLQLINQTTDKARAVADLLATGHKATTRVARHDAGQTLVEYVLIILFVSIVFVGALAALAALVGGFFADALSAL